MILTAPAALGSPFTHMCIFRPDRDDEWLAQQKRYAWLAQLMLAQTRADIDGYGVPARIHTPVPAWARRAIGVCPTPDPKGAGCVACNGRIRSHNRKTAFLLSLEIDPSKDSEYVGIAVCCETCSQLDDAELARHILASRDRRRCG